MEAESEVNTGGGESRGKEQGLIAVLRRMEYLGERNRVEDRLGV